MPFPSIRRFILALLVLTLTPIALMRCGGGEIFNPDNPTVKAFCAILLGVGGNPNYEWIAGSDGLLLHSEDGGQSFDRVVTPFDYGITDLSFSPDGTIGYAVGLMGSYARSEDSGKNWNTQMVGNQDFHSITWAPDNANEGWIVGNGGSIYFTQDQGKNWAHQDSKTQEDLYGVCFTQGGQGWAVGDNGTIVGTINKGSDWQPWNSGVNVNLRACFRDFQFGVAVGYEGTIIETNDGGVMWDPIDSGVKNNLYDIKFQPNLMGGFNGNVIAGGNGVIIRSQDFGNTWKTVYDDAIAGFAIFLKRFDFGLNNDFVYAVGQTDLGLGFDFEIIPDLVPAGETPSSDGLTLRSEDDGETWIGVQLQVRF